MQELDASALFCRRPGWCTLVARVLVLQGPAPTPRINSRIEGTDEDRRFASWLRPGVRSWPAAPLPEPEQPHGGLPLGELTDVVASSAVAVAFARWPGYQATQPTDRPVWPGRYSRTEPWLLANRDHGWSPGLYLTASIGDQEPSTLAGRVVHHGCQEPCRRRAAEDLSPISPASRTSGRIYAIEPSRGSKPTEDDRFIGTVSA